VEDGSASGRQPLEERITDQHVGEAEAVAARVGRQGHIVELHHLVERSEQLRSIEPGDLGQDLQRELLPDDRSPVEHVSGAGGDVG
jgi:hypothetical protein